MAENSTEEQIEELAELQFSTREIAIICQMDHEELVNKYLINIQRGRLKSEAEVRSSICKLAKQGSTPAQKQFLELNAKMKQIEHAEKRRMANDAKKRTK